MNFDTEVTALGRIVVPAVLPDGFAVFYTTRDFHGRLDDAIGRQIATVGASRIRVRSFMRSLSAPLFWPPAPSMSGSDRRPI